eukprot:3039523-Rhodomonas_salina.2
MRRAFTSFFDLTFFAIPHGLVFACFWARVSFLATRAAVCTFFIDCLRAYVTVPIFRLRTGWRALGVPCSPLEAHCSHLAAPFSAIVSARASLLDLTLATPSRRTIWSTLAVRLVVCHARKLIAALSSTGAIFPFPDAKQRIRVKQSTPRKLDTDVPDRPNQHGLTHSKLLGEAHSARTPPSDQQGLAKFRRYNAARLALQAKSAGLNRQGVTKFADMQLFEEPVPKDSEMAGFRLVLMHLIVRGEKGVLLLKSCHGHL